MLVKTFAVQSEEHLEQIAKDLATNLKPPCLIFLDGELGAGKTTFVRFLTQALGVFVPVSSPTFSLQHIYENSNCRIEHWDIYRLTEITEELLEPLDDKTVRIIEWACKFKDVLPKPDLLIEIYLGEEEQERLMKVGRR